MDKQSLLVFANRSEATLLPDNEQLKNRLEIRSETSSRKYVVAQCSGRGSNQGNTQNEKSPDY